MLSVEGEKITPIHAPGDLDENVRLAREAEARARAAIAARTPLIG